MDRFELFCMMYFALDAYYYDVKKSEGLLWLLGAVDPFIWEDRGSADPVFFTDFCEAITQEEVSIEESKSLARKYLETLDIYKEEALEAFDYFTEERWIEGVKEYLKSPHK